MVINGDTLKSKIDLLGMAISKNIASKQSEKMILFDSINNIVYAYTSDGINNIRVEIGPTTEDFYVIVDYATFASFIKNCEGDITLEAKSKFLYVKSSNVKCKIPTHNHESTRGSGDIPDPTGSYTYDNQLTEPIDLKLIKSVLDPNHIVEIYRNVYFGDNIMVSDTDNVIMKQHKLFNKDILLTLSSIEILSCISNIEYTYTTIKGVNLLCIKSDELYATMVIINNDNNEFQYSDFEELFNDITGASVTIDTSILSKAFNASTLFNINPKIVFNPKGIFVQIDTFEFIYKISDVACEERIFELDSGLIKRLVNLGKDITLYYSNENLIKCEIDNIKAIYSVTEVTDNG